MPLLLLVLWDQWRTSSRFFQVSLYSLGMDTIVDLTKFMVISDIEGGWLMRFPFKIIKMKVLYILTNFNTVTTNNPTITKIGLYTRWILGTRSTTRWTHGHPSKKKSKHTWIILGKLPAAAGVLYSNSFRYCFVTSIIAELSSTGNFCNTTWRFALAEESILFVISCILSKSPSSNL
jgi:hypothetical protein